MPLIKPQDLGYVGGDTRLHFDQPVSDLKISINDAVFHSKEGDAGPNDIFSVDFNGFSPGVLLTLELAYVHADGSTGSDSIVLKKPNHELAGMGASVIRLNGAVDGAFFKFWLPKVQNVYIRGSFNQWTDIHRLDQLGETGYWFGYVPDAIPGDDYRFFVFTFDGKAQEVSDPAARATKKTRFNEPADAQDANGVIVDPTAFSWRHDSSFATERRDHRRMVIYQAHWGTFLRQGNGDLPYNTFVTGSTEEEKRSSVRNRLRYVRDLGFTALELLPIHEANGDRNAGYDPSFFFAVETSYGIPDDLRLLVDEAHGLGLAVIFDSVINHLTAELSRSSFSQEFIRGWYTRSDAPWSNHLQWGGSDWGPDPDYDRDQIRNLLTDCMQMYVDEFHVDGIRFDATTTIPSYALKKMIGRLNAHPSVADTYLIAEHLTSDPLPYVVGEIGFNAGWYKPAFDEGMGAILGRPGRGDLQALRKVFETDYKGETASAIKYLIGSHDENWKSHGGKSSVSQLGGSGNAYARMKIRLAWALGASALGIPMMFMGNECLDDITWDNNAGYGAMDWQPPLGSHGANLKQLIREINQLRQRHAALRGNNIDSQLVHWDDDNGVAAYKRWDQTGGVMLILINISDRQWGSRDYQVSTGTPNSVWHEVFNSQFVNFGGWTGACNSDPSFFPRAESNGLLQGINVAKWCLLILKLEN